MISLFPKHILTSLAHIKHKENWINAISLALKAASLQTRKRPRGRFVWLLIMLASVSMMVAFNESLILWGYSFDLHLNDGQHHIVQRIQIRRLWWLQFWADLISNIYDRSDHFSDSSNLGVHVRPNVHLRFDNRAQHVSVHSGIDHETLERSRLKHTHDQHKCCNLYVTLTHLHRVCTCVPLTTFKKVVISDSRGLSASDASWARVFKSCVRLEAVTQGHRDVVI